MGRGKLIYIAVAILIILAGGILYYYTAGVGKERVVVVHTWGGDLGESFRKNIVEPFEKKYGIKVIIIEGMAADAEARVRLGKEHPEIDVACMCPSNAIKLWKEGLIEELKPEEIPELNNIYDFAKLTDEKGRIFFVGMYGYTTELIYRTDKIKKNITSWKDLWDPDFKGVVMLSAIPYNNAHGFVMIARAWGGSEYNVEPAFEKIKELAEMGNLAYVYRTDMEPFDLISSGEAWIGDVLSFTSAALIKAGVPVKRVIPEEGVPVGLDGLTLVKNAPHPEEAKLFINFVLAKEQNEKHANTIGCFPTNKYAEIYPEVAPFVPTREEIETKLLKFDEGYIAEHIGEWLERWEKEIAPLLGR
ncbi:MAG: hypothetical protein DRN04_11805 [Thermoprotei archaeon]|nr:MAG: hypothetical protein DRN04_11805 [Thermoprotei archaeon]